MASLASFLIVDPPLPTTTILYQNFPNPFPSATAFSTCFWFDVGEPGGTVSLDVLDLRGNVVRTIVPTLDGVTQFAAGRYGRGAPGAGSAALSRNVHNRRSGSRLSRYLCRACVRVGGSGGW